MSNKLVMTKVDDMSKKSRKKKCQEKKIGTLHIMTRSGKKERKK